LALIRSLITAGVIVGGIHLSRKMGIPQGSPLRPFLCNLFLHALDVKIEEVCKEQTVGKKRPRNKVYNQHNRKFNYAVRKGDMVTAIKERKIFRSINSIDIISPNGNRVVYLRYADDILILVTGPKSLAMLVLQILNSQLEIIGLRIKESKTNVVYAEDGVMFLGAKIWKPNKRALRKGCSKATSIKGVVRTRRVRPYIGIGVSVLYILKKLEAKGVVKYNHKYKIYNGTAVKGIINLRHVDIIKYFKRL